MNHNVKFYIFEILKALMESLQKLGLNEREINIYTTLLKYNPLQATKIAEKTGIDRATTYRIIQKLIKKGFASYFTKNNVKYFDATEPDMLLDYVNETKDEIEKLLPILNSLKRKSEAKTKVNIFEGKEGMKTVAKDIIKTSQDYFILGYEGQFSKIFHETYLEQYLRKLKNKNIKERIIVKKGTKMPKKYTKNSEIGFISEKYAGPSTIIIYGNKIGHVIWAKPYYIIIIENEEINKSFRKYFDLIWKISSKNL